MPLQAMHMLNAVPAKLQELLLLHVQHSSHHTVLLSEGNKTASLCWHAELQDTTRLVPLMWLVRHCQHT